MSILAARVVPRDEKLDDLNRAASHKLVERMAQDPDQLRGYLNLIFIGRCLERVGDHATNIAEDAVYAAAAEDIRHPVPRCRNMRDQWRARPVLPNFPSSGCLNERATKSESVSGL